MPLNYRLLRDRVEMGFFRISLRGSLTVRGNNLMPAKALSKFTPTAKREQ